MTDELTEHQADARREKMHERVWSVIPPGVIDYCEFWYDRDPFASIRVRLKKDASLSVSQISALAAVFGSTDVHVVYEGESGCGCCGVDSACFVEMNDWGLP